MKKPKLINVGFSFKDYYATINHYYTEVFSRHLMLHYPLYKSDHETLEQRMHNLTDLCVSLVGDLKEKNVLEVGCGNGVQSAYVYKTYSPAIVTGVDINPDNIAIAQQQAGLSGNIIFCVDDAQKLDHILHDSIDTLFCIESAFHYADKKLFLENVHRVLKPGGEFLLADILSKSQKKRYWIRSWKEKMNFYHWTDEQYRQAFSDIQGLQLLKSIDITSLVIQGYKGYRGWVTRRQCSSLISYLLMQIFLLIFVNSNTIALKNRRIYMIYSGVKSPA